MQYVLQSKILQVGPLISTHIHSMFVGSKSVRLFTTSEFDTYTKIPPPTLFLSLRKIVLKPPIDKFWSKIEEFDLDSIKHKPSVINLISCLNCFLYFEYLDEIYLRYILFQK